MEPNKKQNEWNTLHKVQFPVKGWIWQPPYIGSHSHLRKQTAFTRITPREGPLSTCKPRASLLYMHREPGTKPLYMSSREVRGGRAASVCFWVTGWKCGLSLMSHAMPTVWFLRLLHTPLLEGGAVTPTGVPHGPLFCRGLLISKLVAQSSLASPPAAAAAAASPVAVAADFTPACPTPLSGSGLLYAIIMEGWDEVDGWMGG